MTGLGLNEFNVLKTDSTITTFREVAGATIQLPHAWYIDANFLYGEADATQTDKNMFTFNGMQEALNGTLPGNVGQFFNPFADESVAGPNSAFYGNKNLIGSIWENIRSDIMQFHAVGLEPGKTYHVFVLAVEQGPQCIAFAEFETLA